VTPRFPQPGPVLKWVVTLGLVLTTLLMSSGVGRAQEVAPDVSIAIVDAPRVQEKWGYAPKTRTVEPGTWVTWSNDGQEAHTVTALDGSFDSGDLDPSEGFSWYFDQPGRYPYTCAEHAWMSGTIVVADDGASDGE
jgi:plastocyanin